MKLPSDEENPLPPPDPKLPAWLEESLSPAWKWAPMAGQLADAITTELALRDPRNVEGNPLMGNRLLRLISKAGVGLLGKEVVGRLDKSDHDNGARVASALMALLGFVPAGLNASKLGGE